MNFINNFLDRIDQKKAKAEEKKRFRSKELEDEIIHQKKTETNWKIVKILMFLLVAVGLPVGITLFGTVVEYWIIQPIFTSRKLILPKTFAYLQLATIPLFIFINFILIKTWKNRNNKFREKFVLVSSLSIFFIIVLNILSLVTNTPPWRTQNLFNFVFFNKSPNNLYTNLEIVLMLVISSFYIYVINQYYNKWDGKVSKSQFEREEFSGVNNLLLEIIFEYNRIINNEELLKEYTPSHHNLQPILPEQDIISNSWHDQSRELLMLYSVSYSFDHDQDWHDLFKCWIGSNNRSGNTVLLIPRHDNIEREEIENIIKYTKGISKHKNIHIEIIIVAAKNIETDKTLNVKGITVQFKSENSLLDGLINLTDYKNVIRKKVTLDILAESQLTLEKVYVKPIVSILEDTNNSDLESYLYSWLQESSRRHLAILGDYGLGKSTAALMFTYNLLFSSELITKRIPILIQLQGINLKDQDLIGILGNWASKYKMNGQALLRLHEAGRLLLIFEGFDEISQLADYEVRRRHFKSVWAFSAYKEAKIIITGRPNLFESSKEMESALGLVDPFPGEAYCEPLRLSPFNVKQIESSLRNHPTNVKENICNLAIDNERFREIVSRPSLLQIVATLWEKEGLSDIIIGLTPALIMGLFIRHSYTRQLQKEKDSPQFSSLNSSERSYFMSGIATYMASRRFSTITNLQLNELIDDLLLYIPSEVSAQGNLISGETNIPLKKRLEKTSTNNYDSFKVDLLRTDIRSSGLLVVDHTSEESFKFGHKSFSEYLFAEVINERITNPTSKRERAIVKATETSIFSIMNQQVSMVFLSELLSQSKYQLRNFDKDQLYNKCNSLLFALLNANPLNFFLYKIGISIKVFFSSLDEYMVYGSSKLTYKNIINALIVFLLTLILFSILHKFFSINEIILFYLSTAFIYLLAFSVNRALKRNSIFDKLRIWLIVCRYLGIPDYIIHQVIGTNRFPWILKQHFTHFFYNEERELIKHLQRKGEYNGYNIFLIKDYFSKKTTNYINSFVVLNHIKHYYYNSQNDKDKRTFEEILRIFYSTNE